jgi:hypothetical protein
MKPSVVVELLRDPSRVATQLIKLREALPHANVSLLVANQPDLLLQVPQLLSHRACLKTFSTCHVLCQRFSACIVSRFRGRG